MSREKFEYDLKRGQVGEKVAFEILQKSSKTKVLIDASKDKYFQTNDVDILQVLTDGAINRIEVKTDSMAHKTGNIAYETWSNRNEGCLSRTIANLIFYYLSETKTMYVIDMKKMRDYVQTHCYEEVEMGDGASGYLIKIDELIKEKVMVKIYG